MIRILDTVFNYWFPRFYSGSNSQLPDPGRTPMWLYTELF